MADRSAALDALTTQSFPFVLVASKCDIRNNDGPFEPVLDNYEIHRTSPESPRSQKMCIALVLRSVIGNKYGEFAAPVYSPSVPPPFARAQPGQSWHKERRKGERRTREEFQTHKHKDRTEQDTGTVHVAASPRRGLEFSVRVRFLVLCRSAVETRCQLDCLNFYFYHSRPRFENGDR